MRLRAGHIAECGSNLLLRGNKIAHPKRDATPIDRRMHRTITKTGSISSRSSQPPLYKILLRTFYLMLSGISHAAGITLAAAGGELHVRGTVDPILGTVLSTAYSI